MFIKTETHQFTARTAAVAAITTIVMLALIAAGHVAFDWYLFVTA